MKLSARSAMASEDLDIPQIAVVGVSDALPSPFLDSFRLSPSPSPPDNRCCLSLPTPILRLARNSPDAFGCPSRVSDNASLPFSPSPTISAHSSGSIRCANSTVLRDTNPEERDRSSSLYLALPPDGHRRKGSIDTVSRIGSSSTERDVEDNSSSRISPLGSAHSDVTSTLPSPTHPHVDTSSDAGSRPSSVTSFFKRAVHRVRQPSPSHSGETGTGSGTTRNGGQKGISAGVKRKGAQLARPAVLDLKQEADLDVHPFAFRPFQLASLVDPKSLETLEGMGGVGALLRGLGTHPTHGLSTGKGIPPTEHASPDLILPSLTVTHATDKEITSPANEPQERQSTVSLGGGSGVNLFAGFQSPEGVYRTSIEDRQQIFGQNILPRRPSKSVLRLMWLALVRSKRSSSRSGSQTDGHLPQVLLSIYAILSLALGLFQVDHPVDWVEGVAIIFAVLIVVGVGPLNDWQKEKQLAALNEKRGERHVKVIRDGREQLIPVHNVVVGDVVLLEPGEVIPCDGVFLSGHNVRCDESSATDESDAIKKLPYQECIALRDKHLAEFNPDSPVGDGEGTSGSRRYKLSGLDLLGHTDCFVVSGSKVVEGVGFYLVISVGPKSLNGRIMMGSSLVPPCIQVLRQRWSIALRRDSENTPLLAKVGSIAGGLLLVSLLMRFFVELGTNNPPR
jgi:Ca2+-transporting ATPase